MKKASQPSLPDAVAAVTALRPTAAVIAAEWSTERQTETLAAIIGDHDLAVELENATGDSEIRLQFLPTVRAPHNSWRSRRLPLVASFAALAAVAGTVVALVSGGTGSSEVPAGSLGPAFNPPPGLSNSAIGPKQYSYRVVQQIDLDADGQPVPNGRDAMVNRNWVSPDGDTMSVRTGSQNTCNVFPLDGSARIDEPTTAFLASLPTNVDALNTYLRNHVQGSSSRDEAVFTAVGDALTTADGLASARLRAAFVGVLSRTPGVIVRQDDTDYLGRPAIRADFANQSIRPGEIQSLYFDPTTFQLLEKRNGRNDQPTTYNGPSPAYNAPAPGNADDPETLAGPAFVAVMTKEKAVDKLPTVPGCVTSGIGD
ncbi:MAG TPA: hypothetical protein VFT67_10805 [Jatrophihabitantaceae bacterium]|jgi:hypothetical protein|nr:hypothetical protein [Jatrophihabitantaceae bacterium]